MWAITAIYGGQTHLGTLSNPTYIGRRVWDIKEFDNHPETGKRVVKRIRPESEWTIREIPELRIIPQELWDKVKARRDANYARSQQKQEKEHPHSRSGAGPKYLLSGIIYCGLCGSTYTYSGNRYACSGNKNKGNPFCSNVVTVKKDLAERKILEVIQQRLFAKDAIELFVEEYVTQLQQLTPSIDREISAQTSKLAEAERRIANLITAIESGIVTSATKSALEKAEADKKAAETALAQIDKSRTQRPRIDLDQIVTRYRAKMQDLGNSLGNNLPKARAIIQQLVGKVPLFPNEQGKLEAES